MEWRSGYSGFNTSARPAIAAFGGQYHLFFRDDGDNDGIMHVISDNGVDGVVHEISTSTGTHPAGRARSPRTNGYTCSSATPVAMTG